MDIKMIVVQRGFDIAGNLISDLLSKTDWGAREENISHLYKDLQSIKDNCPDAPDVRETPVAREIPEQREEIGKVDKIVDEICTSDLSPKELFECRECVKEVVKGSDTDVMQKYFVSSASG